MLTRLVAVVLALAVSSSIVALYGQSKAEAVEKELRRLLARNPKDATIRLNLARTLVELDRLTEALAEVDRALTGNIAPEVRFQAGRLLRDLAERRFVDLKQVAPESAPVRELAGLRFERNGQFAEALAEYRAAAALDPRRPGVRYHIGNMLWKLRELEAAADELKRELAASSHHGMANLRLGQVLLARNDDAAAVPYLERAVSAMAQSVEARLELGKAYRKTGRIAEARREWEAIAKVRPEDDQIHYLLGNLYRDMGESALAKRELDKHRQILDRRRALAESR